MVAADMTPNDNELYLCVLIHKNVYYEIIVIERNIKKKKSFGEGMNQQNERIIE